MKRLAAPVLALTLAVGCIAWAIGISCQTYDFDEVQRAHSVWLVSQGLRPYEDFLECHPPYFKLLTPLVSGAFDPGSVLTRLRIVATVGHALFLAGLVVAATRLFGAERRAALLGTALVAFQPATLGFLAEFRIDGWGYALAIWAIVRLERSPTRWRCAEYGLATTVATLLLCPKLTFLTPLVLALDLWSRRDDRDRVIRDAGAYALGAGTGFALVLGFLTASGISVGRTFDLLVRYHLLANAHSGFGHGLFRSVAATPALAVAVCAAAAVWAYRAVRAGIRDAGFPAALAIWLGVQALVVSYPYKQYAAPWLLFGSALLSFLLTELARLPRRIVAAGFVALCAVSLWSSQATARAWLDGKASRRQAALLKFIDAVTDPSDRIVATPPGHPMNRRDVSFIWFNTVDPAGYGTEGILDHIPALSEIVSETRYREELAANPPAIVVVEFWSLYPPRQRAALESFLDERGYTPLEKGGFHFAVRPDRVSRFESTIVPN